MDAQKLSLEAIMSMVKTSITQYASSLCQHYELHPAIMIHILQEIVYENKLTMMNQSLMQLESDNAPTVEMNIGPTESDLQNLNDE